MIMDINKTAAGPWRKALCFILEALCFILGWGANGIQEENQMSQLQTRTIHYSGAWHFPLGLLSSHIKLASVHWHLHLIVHPMLWRLIHSALKTLEGKQQHICWVRLRVTHYYLAQIRTSCVLVVFVRKMESKEEAKTAWNPCYCIPKRKEKVWSMVLVSSDISHIFTFIYLTPLKERQNLVWFSLKRQIAAQQCGHVWSQHFSGCG